MMPEGGAGNVLTSKEVTIPKEPAEPCTPYSKV